MEVTEPRTGQKRDRWTNKWKEISLAKRQKDIKHIDRPTCSGKCKRPKEGEREW
jgi:hypothetical protein